MRNSLLRTVGIMPCYLEKKEVLNVAKAIAKFLSHLVIVMDGRNDIDVHEINGTNISIVMHNDRKGIGEAVKTAINYIKSELQDYKLGNTWILIFDADGQHPIEALKRGLLVLKYNNSLYITGIRDLACYPLYKKIGNFCINIIVSLFVKVKLKDVESGLKIIRADLADYIIGNLDNMSYYSFSIQFNVFWALVFGKPKYFKFKVPFYRKGRAGIREGIVNAIYATKTWIKLKERSRIVSMMNDSSGNGLVSPYNKS